MTWHHPKKSLSYGFQTQEHQGPFSDPSHAEGCAGGSLVASESKPTEKAATRSQEPHAEVRCSALVVLQVTDFSTSEKIKAEKPEEEDEMGHILYNCRLIPGSH